MFNTKPYTAPSAGHGDMRRSAKGGAFWARMGRLEMRLHEMYLRDGGERGLERIRRLRKRVRAAFIKKAQFRRMWLEAGWVQGFHRTCQQGRPRVSDDFATNYRLIIDILVKSVFKHGKYCIARTPIPKLVDTGSSYTKLVKKAKKHSKQADVFRDIALKTYSNGLTHTAPVKRYVAPPKVPDETETDGVTTFKRGRTPGMPAIASTTHDLAFARRLAAAKHRVRAYLLNVKRVGHRGTELRPIVSRSTRSCDPRRWRHTRVDVTMTNRPSSTTVEFKDTTSEKAKTQHLKALTQKWSESDPVLYRVLYAWIGQTTSTMTKSMFARRVDSNERNYAYLDMSESRPERRRVKTMTAGLDVVVMTCKIIALIMIDPKALLDAIDEADGDENASCTITRVPPGQLLPKTKSETQYDAISTLKVLLPDDDRPSDRVMFPYIVEAVAGTLAGDTKNRIVISQTGLNQIDILIEHSVDTYRALLEAIAQKLGVTPYKVCTMLAYTPIRTWGSFTSHTHGRTEDPVSGRSMGGTRAAGCGGVMYLQKEPGRVAARPTSTRRFAHLAPVQQRGRVTPVQPRESGRTNLEHTPSTQAPDVWRGLYNPFVDRRFAYTCVLESHGVPLNDNGNPSGAETANLLFADAARTPASIHVVHVDPNTGARITGARGYIARLQQYVDNMLADKTVGIVDARTNLLKLLHKDYKTLNPMNVNHSGNNTNTGNNNNNKGNTNGGGQTDNAKGNKGNSSGNNGTTSSHADPGNNKAATNRNTASSNNNSFQGRNSSGQTDPTKGKMLRGDDLIRFKAPRVTTGNFQVPVWTPVRNECRDVHYARTIDLGPDTTTYAYTAMVSRLDAATLTNMSIRVSLSSLADGVWLVDEVISQYGALVNASLVRTNREESEWQVLEALYASNLCTKEQAYTRQRPYMRLGKTQWVLPLNIDNTHWVALHVDFVTHTIIVYDSLRGIEHRHGALVRTLALNLNKLHGTSDAWTFGVHAGLQQQNNTWDCGVYTCFVARHLVHGWCMKFTDARGHPLKSRVMRRRILKELVDGRLLAPGAAS
jgi:sentrin-specific protease 1